MSATLTTAAVVASVLSPELKAAVVAAAEGHLVTITSQVNQVKAAVQADLPSVVSTATNVEALVKAEVAKLKGDFSKTPNWIKGVAAAVVAVVLVGGGIAVDHLAKLVF